MSDFPSPEAIEAALLAYHLGSTVRHPDERVNEAGRGYVADIIAAATKVQPVVALPPCSTCKGRRDLNGCPEPVWDGPYKMRCSLGGDGTICARHREFVRETCPSCKGPGVDRLIPESEIREWSHAQRGSGSAEHDSALDALWRWLDEREARQ